MRIAVVGSGYVGLVAGACFAEIGHEVILVDNDPVKYAALERGETPIHEQYLPELLAKHRGKELSFSNSLPDAVRASEAIFIAVGTPPMHNGEADLSYVESVAREIAGAIERLQDRGGKEHGPGLHEEWMRHVMLLNGAPAELLRRGLEPGVSARRHGGYRLSLSRPHRASAPIPSVAPAMLRGYLRSPGKWRLLPARRLPFPDRARLCLRRSIRTSAKSAELIKYASNAFLALKISFINAVATICESVGANIDQVREGIGSDTRIGQRFLYPGIGYGGSCFPKDLSAYRAVARECGYDFGLLEEVMNINEDQRTRFLRKVRQALWTLKDKRLAVLGLAFKGGTDDIRESPAIAIVQQLLKEQCEIVAFDPAAMENAKKAFHGTDRVTYASSAYEAATGADALLVLTEWEEFSNSIWPVCRRRCAIRS